MVEDAVAVEKHVWEEGRMVVHPVVLLTAILGTPNQITHSNPNPLRVARPQYHNHIQIITDSLILVVLFLALSPFSL